MKAFVSKLFKKLASRANVTINAEPNWQVVGQIVTVDGKKRYYRNTCFDINTLGATEIAKDKAYASYFMKKMGYPVISGEAFFSKKWCRQVHSRRNIDMAYRYAKKIGFPVFVKPNSRSQGSAAAKVHTKTEFYRAVKRVFQIDNIVLVQQVVVGKDYRIVVLDDVTSEMHNDFRSTAIRLTKDMGLRYCGVDIMVDGDIKDQMHKWCVIEINAAPGIDNYAASGSKQQKIVEDLYLEVLKSMAK